MKKHVIWDFDGTLFDSYPLMTEAMLLLLKEHGIEENYDTVFKKMKVSMTHLLTYLKNEYELEECDFERFSTIRHEIEKDNLKPFEGVVDICKRVTREGGLNHLYTHRGLSAVASLKAYNMIEDFHGLITKEDKFERKPSPDAINHLIKAYKMDKAEAIMIGDREMDLLSAKNAGIEACFFIGDLQIESEHADYTIRRIEELKDIIF